MARVWPTGEGSMWVEQDVSLNVQQQSKLEPQVDGDRLSFWSPNEVDLAASDEDPEGAALLGLSKVPNSQDVSATTDIGGAQRGSKGITVYGARLVRNACYLLQQKYGKNRLSFLTTTIPGSPDMTCSVAQGWGEVVRRFMQALREKLVRSGLPPFIVSVSEIQMKRFMESGGMPLHLHMVFVGRPLDNAPWVLNKQWINEAWRTAVVGVIPDAAKLNFGPSTRIERIEKDAAGYLGKYMSKGAATVNYVIERYPELYEFLPSTWYNLTHAMRQTVLKYVAYGPVVGEAIEDMTRTQMPAKWFMWFKVVPLFDERGVIIKKFSVFTLSTEGRIAIGLPLNPLHLHDMPDT
jgi:hypothetical protein